LFAIANTVVLASFYPLINLTLNQDYVVQEHLGKVSAFYWSGMSLGTVIGLGGVLTLVQHMDYKYSFLLLGGVTLIWSVFTLFMV